MKRYDTMGFESEYGVYVRWVDAEELERVRDEWCAEYVKVRDALCKVDAFFYPPARELTEESALINEVHALCSPAQNEPESP